MRSAEAARNTSDLIEQTIQMVESGEAVLVETNGSFKEFADQAGKTGALIREISAGSEEQREGVSDINRAVIDLTHLIHKAE
jgi:methyl-accepting chemotaxis protein